MGAPRRLLLAAAILAAASGAAWLQRGGNSPPTLDTAATDDGVAALERPPLFRLPPPAPSPGEGAAAALAELRTMSETYRNTTFLTAIRAAGFVCYELADVYGGVNDSATWTVRCANMLAYTVHVGAAGELIVEPTAQYLDSLPPTVPRDERTPREPTLPR